MESEQNYYYRFTKGMLTIIGQWPYQEERTRLFLLSLLTVTAISVIIPQVNKIIQCDGDMRCIMLVTPALMLIFIILVKLYTCQINNNKIKRLTEHLFNDWKNLEDAEEYEIMKKHGANARLISLTYTTCVSAVSVLYVSISLIPKVLDVVLPLNKSRPIIMPYESYYFVDSEKYFYHIFLHIGVSLAILVPAVLAHDCLLLTYIEHACSIFAVTGFRLEAVSRNSHNNSMNNGSHSVYNPKIAVSVYAHWRALRFAELLEDIFCISFVVQMMLVIITLTVTLLYVALQMDEVVQALRMSGFVGTQTTHLFCYCLQGQRLIDHSVRIREKIYNSSWYNIPAKSQRLLLYVMKRSMQPNFLSAGKIFVFSLKSFTTVLQSSVSYFTVLSSFQ
ncbi:odorant receptor 13a isoform X2 [Monomorium pharaonis]|uniref:odorant receptor 13a isoform X2 n=1 Tax=Monomorium pharaonis TaxID=307658 RepID=UPI00174684D2|nr:odorant receptor 13a isoform X2 [Monomorium pharaonis]